MTTAILKAVADSNQWWALGPELTVACGALALLVLEILVPKKDLRFVPHLAVVTLLSTLIVVALNFDKTFGGEALFGGLIKLSAPGQVARIFFLLSSLLVCFLGEEHQRRRHHQHDVVELHPGDPRPGQADCRQKTHKQG